MFKLFATLLLMFMGSSIRSFFHLPVSNNEVSEKIILNYIAVNDD